MASSLTYSEQKTDLGDRLAILETFREYSEGQSLRTSDRLLARRTVRERSRQITDFGDPPTVFFTLQLDRKAFHIHVNRDLSRLVRTPNGPRFSRAGRDAMIEQLGGQKRSGPRRLQPRAVGRRRGYR